MHGGRRQYVSWCLLCCTVFAATVRTGAIRCACPADGASDAEVSAFLVASLAAEPASLLQAIRALGWQWGVVRDLVAEELMVKSRELCACEAWTRVPIHFASAGRPSDSRAPRAQAVSLLPWSHSTRMPLRLPAPGRRSRWRRSHSRLRGLGLARQNRASLWLSPLGCRVAVLGGARRRGQARSRGVGLGGRQTVPIVSVSH